MSSDKAKDVIDKTKTIVQKGIADAKDAAGEVLHRSGAEAEKTRREVEGDTMTTGEKVASVVNETKHRTQAEIDAAKRNLRDST
jgi:hypothetical protein